MARRKADLDALAEIVQEVRNLKTPDLDWERIEGKLEALPPPRAAEPSKQSGWFWAGFGTLAAGAATALVILFAPNRELPEHAETEPPAQLSEVQTINGDALAVGSKLSATERELTVVHEGHARWILSANSSAALTQKGDRIALDLQSGSLVSHVVKSSKPETFSVRVGNALISVHGTVFRVERRGDRALVDVSEGVVAVSEAEPKNARPRFMLRAASRGNFALDGRTGTIEGNAERLDQLDPKTPAAGRSALHEAPLPSATAGASAAAEPAAQAAAEQAEIESQKTPETLPLRPTIGEVETGVSSTIEALTSCFRERTEAAGGVRVTARTFVTLEITPEGAVRAVSFGPPLAPAVELCAREKVAGLTFARSQEGVTVKRWVDLKR